MLLAAKDAVAFVGGMSSEGFLADLKTQYAVARALEILGEAANAVPEQIRDEHLEIPWANLVALRNRLIHGYFEVKLDVVWDVVTNELPGLIEILQTVVPQEEEA
jgi:uncharacterized protein with HEPN domain